MIPFSKPTLGSEEDEAARRVIHSGWLAAGPETTAFEEEFSTYISPPGEHYYCIYTNSCTSALKMAYKGVKEKGIDGIMYQPNTFCATYAAADEMGLILENIHRFSPESTYIKVNMHYGGVKDENPCLIEDSAHRIEPNDPLVGKIRCYSFYATKNMTTASGGMFVTNDKDIYERARLFWRDGLSTSSADRLNGIAGYRVEALAGGYDGNDLGAAIGRAQLLKLPEFTARRNAIVSRYNNAFGQDWQGNHLYPLFFNSNLGKAVFGSRRIEYSNELEAICYQAIEAFKAQGIQTSHHYPNTGWNGVSLPIYPLLTDDEIDTIIAVARNIREQFS